METLVIPNDISVFYITATSFPAGVLEAHQNLHQLIPYSKERKYFGISRPENGSIIYKAAAEKISKDEGRILGCESMIIPKGIYITETVFNFMDDISSIGKTFQKLLQYPGLDPEGYCVELYLNDKDVQCMIRLMK